MYYHVTIGSVQLVVRCSSVEKLWDYAKNVYPGEKVSSRKATSFEKSAYNNNILII